MTDHPTPNAAAVLAENDRERLVSALTHAIIGKNRPETSVILRAFCIEARKHGIDPKPLYMDALARRAEDDRRERESRSSS